MTAATTCPSCGITTGPDDRFCGACGNDLTRSAPAPKPAAASSMKHTMLGVASPLAPPAGAPAPAGPAASGKVPQKTMLGVMSPLMAPAVASPTPAQPAASPAQPPASAPAAVASGVAAPKLDTKKTMLGVAPGLVPPRGPTVVEPGQAPGKLVASPSSEDPALKQTMFGVPEAAAVPRAPEPAPQAPDPAPAQATGSRGAAMAGPTNRTMLGVAPVVKPGAKPALSPQSKHTMLGAAPPGVALPQPGAQAPEAMAETPVASAPARARDERPRSFTPVPTASEEDDMPAAAPARRHVGLLIGALLVLLLGAAGIAAYVLTRGPALAVRVVATDTGDALEIEVPGSPPGTKVRFAGEEHALEAGRARFALRADSLSLGKNELSVDVIRPSGDVAAGTVQLAVDYRVRADLAPLSAATPGIDVVVDALPGSKATLDGTPLALDTHGHAVKRYPVAAQAGASFNMTARYRIEPPEASPVDGSVNVVLAVTSMQIDRPGPDVVTDQPLVEVAGAVEPSAEVLIDGQVLPVREGRFLHRVRLNEPGEYKLQVVARAAGKAPRVAELKVRRVADLTMAAASFKHDPTLTYARIAQNPLIYRGQNVAFDGRVYNVEVQGGRSVLQMLVLDCPGSARCPLWVEYSQATEATVDSWVRVLGSVAGEQQFRSKQGQVQSVPSVQAQYVLKLAR